MSGSAPSLAAALRPCLPELARDTVAAIGREVPDYSRALEGAWAQTLRGGVEAALERFVDELDGHAEPVEDEAAGLYAGLGRGELRAGRSLDALLSAYRLGARLAWERFCAEAVAAGHPPERLYALAGAIFTYIDAISAESAAAYAEAQSHAAGERARRRRALARGLAAEGAEETELAALAASAEWELPVRIAALVLAGPGDPARIASRLGGEAIAAVLGADESELVAWLPDPDAPGRLAQLTAAFGATGAVLGPTVPVTQGARSLSRARTAMRAAQDGHLPASGLLVAEEHLLTLLLHGTGAPEARDLAARLLAPLGTLAPGARRRSAETLRAWLDHPGQIQRIGTVLGVHPQTVRYRLVGLRELFGERLDEPEARFALALALRAVERSTAS